MTQGNKSFVGERPNSKGFTEVSTSEIEELANSIVKKEDENDIISENFDIPLNMFWDNLFSDKAKFSLAAFMETQGEKEIVMDPWKEQKEENKKEEDKKEDMTKEQSNNTGFVETPSYDQQKLEKQMRLKVNVRGVPFCSSSR